MSMSRDDIKLVTVCYHSLYKMFGKDVPDVIIERLNEELRIVINNGESDAYCMLWWIYAHCTDVEYSDLESKYKSLILFLFRVTELNPCRSFYYCAYCNHIEYRGVDSSSLEYCPECGKPYDSGCYYCGEDLRINKNKTVDRHRAEVFLSIIRNIIKKKDELCCLSDKDAYVLSRALSICDMKYGIYTIKMVVEYLILDKILDGKLEEYVDERYA